MEFFDDEKMRDLLEQSLETAELGADGFRDVGSGPAPTRGTDIDWLTISDPEQSVVDDVARIRAHPLVPSADSDLRLRLRREDRAPRRGAGRNRGGPSFVTRGVTRHTTRA